LTTEQAPDKGPLVLILMGFVGAWAGLIAVDSATYALAVLVLAAHFSIREANAIKVTTLGLAALVSLIIFSGQGCVDWRVASLLAVGSVLGARLAPGPHAAKWVFRLLVAAVQVEVVRLAAGFVRLGVCPPHSRRKAGNLLPGAAGLVSRDGTACCRAWPAAGRPWPGCSPRASCARVTCAWYPPGDV
jgi:uncharacterized membrane protein YfcA